MTTLIQGMREDLVRRDYAESTIRSYLHTIEDFRRFTEKRLDHLGLTATDGMRIGKNPTNGDVIWKLVYQVSNWLEVSIGKAPESES